ncbi:MAG: DUF1801 domain-containing protein [Candidatus Marinimicrobia bacterium]|nr:DUF1801 domain-containing protein [Candidatus Neomarinimicrobiota bacterium]
MSVEFTPDANQVEVKEIFEAEKENSIEQQRLGWQSILNNFKDYVETRAKTGFRSIEEYIACFPGETQSILKELQRVIKAAAPDAEEKISYQMPTFAQNGNLVHFAAYKNHIGFYPAPSAILAFKEDLAKYQGGKGSIQFPINEPLPYELIRRIVRFRVNENLTK